VPENSDGEATKDQLDPTWKIGRPKLIYSTRLAGLLPALQNVVVKNKPLSFVTNNCIKCQHIFPVLFTNVFCGKFYNEAVIKDLVTLQTCCCITL